jgi:SH3 domain protein
MNRRAIVLCLVIFLLLFLQLTAMAQTIYVTDSITITMRNGPSTQHRILKMLPSGTKLEVVDDDSNQDSGWIRVATPDGTTGWVLKSYTMDKEPRDVLVQRLRSERDELKGKNIQFQEELDALKKQIAQFKETATDSHAEVSNLKRKVSSLRTELEEAEKNDQRKWFLYGAGVVAGSALVGFIFGRIQRRKTGRLRY